jgi:hypothetical protein
VNTPWRSGLLRRKLSIGIRANRGANGFSRRCQSDAAAKNDISNALLLRKVRL